MNLRCAVILLAPLALAGLSHAQQPSAQLKATLDQLDAASARFSSAQADFHKVFYNALIKADEDTQSGAIYFIRGHEGSTQMGLKTTGQGARTVEYKSGTVRVYNPATDCFDTVTRPGVETYLTLGFGGSGKDLEKAWVITDLGSDTVGGVKVEKLDLVPRDAGVKANITKVTLWLDLSRGVSLKQALLAPSNDLQTATYTNIRLNGKVDTKPFAIKGKACGK